jgi:hypothetical protein
METLLKITGVIAALVIPIVLCILNNRIAKIKHSREHRAELLKLAADFESGLEGRSILYKDRMSKALFDSDNFTFMEAKYFSKYENADRWVEDYTEIRRLLQRIRDEEGNIISFTPKTKIKTLFFFVLGYFLTGMIGLIPLLKFNIYVRYIVDFYEQGSILAIFFMVAIPLILLMIAWLCLKYLILWGDCRFFLRSFRKEAVMLPQVSVNPNQSE